MKTGIAITILVCVSCLSTVSHGNGSLKVSNCSDSGNFSLLSTLLPFSSDCVEQPQTSPTQRLELLYFSRSERGSDDSFRIKLNSLSEFQDIGIESVWIKELQEIQKSDAGWRRTSGLEREQNSSNRIDTLSGYVSKSSRD
jgi:hypothetical protein